MRKDRMMATKLLIDVGPDSIAATYRTIATFRIAGHEFESPIELERFDPEACADTFADRARDTVANAAALSLAEMIAKEKGSPTEDAVYVIGTADAEVCKVGRAVDPINRLRSLQTGRPDDLVIHALFWSMECNAAGLEALCLRVATKLGLRMRGEWLNVDPVGAADLIANVAASINSPFADSAMWLRNRKAMLDARAEHAQAIRDRSRGLGYSKQRFGDELVHSRAHGSQDRVSVIVRYNR